MPRYYSLFRFYTTKGVTDKERQEVAALGEVNTTRVIGHDNPDAIDPKQVWGYLRDTGTMPNLEGKTIQTGALAGMAYGTIRSWDTIDTHQPTYRDWRPIPEQVIEYPVVDVTAIPL